MSDYAFGIKTPREFLQKARREVGRLETAEVELADPVAIQDQAINTAWTMWHVADWIAKYPDPAYRAAIERIRQESQTLKTKPREIVHEYILTDADMALCEALANGAKHFELYEQPHFASTRILNRGSAVHADAAEVDLETTVSAGSSAVLLSAIRRYFPKLKINGHGVPALDVFKAALAYWDRFFNKYGL